ncbi:MAG: hypothetical protein AAGU19_11385 [Prolixibacteraceae bacterium]
MKNIPLVIFYAILLLLTACDRFPKDSEDTLQNARNKILKVGLSAYDPAAGASVEPVANQLDFVRQFAKELSAEVVWVKGSQGEIIQLLSHYKLHMAIGGYMPSSPFVREVTLTKPYYREKLMLAGFDRPVPRRLKGEEVLVKNHLAALYVKEEGGIPVMASGFERNAMFVKIPRYSCSIRLLKKENWSWARHLRQPENKKNAIGNPCYLWRFNPLTANSEKTFFMTPSLQKAGVLS